jgi:hypothetical protein
MWERVNGLARELKVATDAKINVFVLFRTSYFPSLQFSSFENLAQVDTLALAGLLANRASSVDIATLYELSG